MEIHHVQARSKAPLAEFIWSSLQNSGCKVLHASPSDQAPFRITFETPLGERLGIVVYAFLANQRLTKNRPSDEHRFQVKYGSKDGKLHELWQDRYGLYTTLFCGINPEQGFFVAADPVLHNPTKFFISVEFKQEHVDEILKHGWHAWERERRTASTDEPTEVLVGGTAESFLRYIRFEREALGEDQGHRQLLAERFADGRKSFIQPALDWSRPEAPPKDQLHALAHEFELSEHEVLDVIASARRLKMAVRGWVAEEHLYRTLQTVPGVEGCRRLDIEGGADVELSYRGSRPFTIECKNVLRKTLKDGTPRVDFQRTRASKSDPCSRYYAPTDFDMVAACLHSVTEQWEFCYALPRTFDPHKKCRGKLSNRLLIDDRWAKDPTVVLEQLAG